MKINKISLRLSIAVSILLVLAASGFAQKVTYNFMPGTDFSRYKTYQWVKVEKAHYPNQLLDEQIMASIDRQLSMKGLTKTTEGIPDLVVTYQAAVDQKEEWSAYTTGGGWGWGGWYGWGGMSSTSVYSNTITTGSLNLDVYDVSTKKQIWRGEATKTLGQPKDPAKLQKNLDKAMAKLLKNYPPPPKK